MYLTFLECRQLFVCVYAADFCAFCISVYKRIYKNGPRSTPSSKLPAVMKSLSHALSVAILGALALLTLSLPSVHSKATNITIDDYFGDEVTGIVPKYQPPPPEGWNFGQNCTKCAVHLDSNSPQIHKGTWRDVTRGSADGSEPATNMTLSFIGMCGLSRNYTRINIVWIKGLHIISMV